MATRNISTKLAITGESEYRASLAKINTELKMLASALKLTESQYQTNANSMQALQAKGKALNDLYQAQKTKVQELRNALDNAKQAENKYAQQKAELQKKIDENNKALEKLKQTTGDTSKEEAKLTEENAKLQKELEGVDAKLTAAEKGTNSWQTQLNNAEIQLNNLDAEIQKNDKYLDEASKSADGCAHSIDEFGREVQDSSEELKTMGTILASEELRGGLEKVTAAIAECVTEFAAFENGMAAVKRTTGITGPELEELGKYFRELSLEVPITTEELTKIATTAGQLGVKGSDNVRSFTNVIAKLATTTDLTADNAATMLAQFANITGQKTASDYEHLGSVVASLGDATATTATKVVEMSQGIAATGTLAGMGATDIMAISAAVGSLGIESTAGSTAMSTLISTLYKAVQTGDKLSDFANVAGMSAGEFRQAWGRDAVGALNSFITGLNDTERNGKSAIVILDELGITNVRQTKAILGLASAGDLLTGTIAQANQAWAENTALNDKAAVMFDTLQAKMTVLDNSTAELKRSVGEALAPAMTKLVETGTDAIKIVNEFVQKNPTLVEALTIIVGSLAAITTGIATAKAAYKALDFLGMTGALKSVGAAAAAAGGGVAGLATALGTIALPAAAAAVALAGIVAIVDEAKTLNSIGFLGEGKTLDEYAKNVENCRLELQRAQEDYNALAECGADLTAAQNELDHANIALSNATKEYEAALESATGATEEATGATENFASAQAAAEAAAEDIRLSLNDIAKAYSDAYNSALDSLKGQIGLFDEYAASISEDTDTASEMLDLWARQTTNLGQYTADLKRAAELGLDEGLVQSLADGSTESAGYLRTIIQEIENANLGLSNFASSGDEAVARFNESFQRTEEAKENLAETMAAINTSVEDAIRSMEEQAAAVNFDGFYEAVNVAFGNVGVDFQGIGVNIGSGLSSGIDSSSGDVESSARGMADNTIDAAKNEFGVNSPSTVFREIGYNLDAGLAEGITSNSAQVTGAITGIAAEINQAMYDAGFESAEFYAKGLENIQSETNSQLADLQSTLSLGTAGMYDQMFGIGSNVVMGMIQGIYSQSGYLYDAVYSVTQSAIAAAQTAAGVASPSKKTKKIFEFVGEGMAVGIESKRERIATATQRVVDNAMDIDLSEVIQAIKNQQKSVPDFSSLLSGISPGMQWQESTFPNDCDINFNIEKMEVRSEADIQEIADRIGQMFRLEMRRRGRI